MKLRAALCLVFTYALQASAAVPECVNGRWIHQTTDNLPHIDCSRTPVAVRWSALTPERCAAWKDDEAWPLQDPHIIRKARWQSARSLAHQVFKNKVVWIVGDSITNLFYRGINCEFQRFGLTYVNDDLLQAKFDAIPKNHFGWESGPPYAAFKYPAANFTFTFKGWHKVFRNEWQIMFEMGDIFIVNYGLHYMKMAEYADDIRWLFSECQRRNATKTCVFRETSAQIFPNGAYTPDSQNGLVCGTDEAKLFSPDNFVYSQNQKVLEILKDYPGVKFLPFYNISAVRADLLEEKFCEIEARRDNPKAQCLDCTHMLMTPTLFAKIVADLYDLL